MAKQLELFDEPEGSFSGHADPTLDPVPDSPHPSRGSDESLTAIAAQFARGLQLPKLAESVDVSWNPRMRTAAGRAFYRENRIELNPKLQALPPDQRGAEIQNTFLHELAHLVSFARAKGKRIQPHGPEWKQACADLGIPDEDRCHELNFQPRRMKRRYAYECLSCGEVIERVRRLNRRVACYSCCKEHSGGRYDPRFRLVEKPLP
ncbi:MAG: SprT-like domain-containing protein [Verrucomicrobiota bacterium]